MKAAKPSLEFADGQDRHRPWDVRIVTPPAPKRGKRGGEAEEEAGSEGRPELVGISAKTPWEITKTEKDARPDEEQDETKGASTTGSGKRPRGLTDEEDEEVRKAVSAVRRARAHAVASRGAIGREEDWDLPTQSKAASFKTKRGEGLEPAQTQPREICLRNYAAVGAGDTAADERMVREMEEGGKQRRATKARCQYYGLIDQGVAQDGVRCLIMHAPPHSTPGDSATDRVRPGSVLRVHSTAPHGVKGHLRVRFTTPERYYAPGTRVSTLRIGVDASDWTGLTPGA